MLIKNMLIKNIKIKNVNKRGRMVEFSMHYSMYFANIFLQMLVSVFCKISQ